MSVDIPLGLAQFPVTKLCMVVCVGITLVASLFQTKYWFLLQYDPFISEYEQYWRYFTFQLGAVNESDVALYTLIWYEFRQLERLFGSRRYVNMLALCWVYNTLTLWLSNKMINVLPLVHWNRFSSGPLAICMSLFHFYKEYTPRVYEFDVLLAQPLPSDRSKQLEWTLSDQFLINGLVLLLMLNQGLVGFLIGLIGWICGLCIDKGLLPGKDFFNLPLWPTAWSHTPSTAPDSLRASTAAPEGDVFDEAESEEQLDEPARPLGVQFLDTFRR
ncbi:AER209Wp [Eremothecium gossypii ATCC 10895]|uniref:AER209Wp n=1 Tax=Eremothecium gossypii (strain ATCC 10895 / CBS 109.51 / FGSC 9923 / NRRL Y-1056) TaxID=284811 RepID=Q756P5_EREGS|nr:AER209Wp [Eremothecium gossypii ATCC 10895]AAS52890.1 AER209Wp [Eremothecium gossypii ATCC 10895]AEY97198.1 FAER209Wp [Eremothecium gossypii FDAG1]